jgi:hypothetical protein
MMGIAGNEAIINRETVLYNGERKNVPVLSGNAIRHKMVREPGALHLVDTCGLRGKLTLDQANYLLNGGSLTESSATDNLTKIAQMQELLPLYRALGGSLRNQVIGGSLIVTRGVLLCRENAAIINKCLPAGFTVPENLLPAEDFISHSQYTRGDAGRRRDSAALLDEPESADDTNLMIYSGQTIVPGAMFYHGFILQNVSLLEVGALLNALYEWGKYGTIGGSARIGHGKLHTYFFFEEREGFFGSELNPEELTNVYRVHCEQNREKIAEWLATTFPRRERKPAGEKPAKKAKKPTGAELAAELEMEAEAYENQQGALM